MKNLKTQISTISILVFLSLSVFSQELTILHTNDMHSKLTGYGPESEYSPLITGNDKTLGGFSRLAALFSNSKTKNKDATLILDDGDFLMGSLFHVAEEETGFQLNLMKNIGYDVITIGNHEFDFGPNALANIINKAKEKGGFPDIVCSNIIFDAKSDGDNKLEKLYSDNEIKEFTIIEKNGLKIAIFGLVGVDAADVAPASKPVSFENPIETALKIVDKIKTKHNPDLIICLSHSGIDHKKTDGKYTGEDIELAKKVNGIDIIISGHTHSVTEKPIKVNNTYIVQTGSYIKNLGEIKLKIKDGKIIEFNFQLIPVDDKILGNQLVYGKIQEQKELINNVFLKETGLTYETKVAQINFDLKKNYSDLKSSNLGPFIADATKYYLKKNGIIADFSMVASGTIREDLVKGENGIITVPDVFRVMSLGKGYDNVPGYPLAMIYLTGREVKKLMEILVMSRAKGGDGYLYTSGLKIYTNPAKMMLRKVQKVEIDGKEIDISKKNKNLYSIAANTYLLSFFGEIKKMSHGLVSVIPKDKDGKPIGEMRNQLIDINSSKKGVQEAKEWIALIEFMESFKNKDNGFPIIPEKYKKGDESLIEE